MEGHGAIFENNALSLYGLETLGGFEAIIPSHYVRFAQEAGATRTGTGRALAFTRWSSPLLDLAGLRFLFLHRDIPAGERFRLVGEYDALNLYENPKALPRAYMVSGALLARDEDQAASLLRDPAFRPSESVVLGTSGDVPSGPPGAVACDIRWIERTSDRLRLEVSSAEGGFLVLSDTDYPGWAAEVDGQSAPIYRANLAFRALKLSSGRHQVEFRFSPDSVRWGLLGSAVSTALALAWIAARRFRPRAGLSDVPRAG